MRELEQPIIMERRKPIRKYSLGLEEVKQLAKEGDTIPIFRRLSAALETPFSVFAKVRESKEGAQGRHPSVLMESVAGGETVGRYSYICIDPKETISLETDELSIISNDGAISTQKGERIDPLKAIQEKGSKTIKTPGLPPFYGGNVGCIGYGVSSAFQEKVPKSKPDVLKVPEAVISDYDFVIAYDHARREMKVIGNMKVGKAADLERQYQETTARIDAIANRITNAAIVVKTKTKEEQVGSGVMRPNQTKEEYSNNIQRIKEYLRAGDAIQVVYSQRWARETNIDPLDIYRNLMNTNPSPFMFYMEMVDKNNRKIYIIGASPELLLEVKNRRVTTWPIAGTRPRGGNDVDDMQLEEDLLRSEKERAEHIMLVDLGRNDIGKISKFGTVEVPELMEVKRYSTVMHMGSKVTGILRDDLTSFDAFRSIFPAGTVSGAPKIRAMQIIDELEPEQRGFYAGAFGYISQDGDMEMAIGIRTIVMIDGVAYLQAGGGIVYDSDVEGEFNETIAKSRGASRAIDQAEEGF